MDNEFSRLVEQYMLMDKKTLAQLLALKELANRQDVPVIPTYPTVPSIPWPYPVWPNTPGDYPWWPQIWYTTKTTDGGDYQNWTPNKCELNRQDVVENTKSSPDINVSNGFCGGCNYGDRNIS